MRKGLIILFLSLSPVLSSQTILTIEGQTYTNNSSDWSGVLIPHSVLTALTFRNNSITSVNATGYMLQAGDEAEAVTNDNLDGAVITGNKLTWNGTDASANTHGVFIGFNKNDNIKYNFLDKLPYGVVIKSGTNAGVNMTYTSGGFAYNIVKNSKIGVRIKGINGVLVYNNTFYDNVNTGTNFLFITSNGDVGIPKASTGTKVKNNIFYSSNQVYNIYLESGNELGFESDYNVFYCASGTPMFNFMGAAKTFAQWQALGYDIHSVVINPNFINNTSLVPSAHLDYGTNLGTTWETGLSTTAAWTVNSAPAATAQNGTWQVGACIYNAISVIPNYFSSVVENNTPIILEMTYSVSLANIAPSASAFNVQVNSATRAINSVTIVNGKVRLTLSSPIAYHDIITVAYSKPTANPLQTDVGETAASNTAQPVVNNCINIPPGVTITSPVTGSSFTAPATISLTANSSDTDGTVSKVEFYQGNILLGEKTLAPFSFTWNNVDTGTYLLTAVATDNFNAKTTSTSVVVHINPAIETSTELIKLYPNPNKGKFFIEVIKPFQNENNTISIISLAGKKVYDGTLLKKEITRQFDLAYVDSGIYILIIIGKEILITKKFIKD